MCCHVYFLVNHFWAKGFTFFQISEAGGYYSVVFKMNFFICVSQYYVTGDFKGELFEMRDEYKAFRRGNIQNGWDHTDAQILLSYLSLIL